MKTKNIENFEAELASIHELIELAHNPELATEYGVHVTQIWADGEITSQKGGELLWRRSLFRMIPGIDGLKLKMPRVHGVHTYAFVTKADAYEIGRQIVNLITRYPQIDIAPVEIERYRMWMDTRSLRAA